MGIFTYGHKKCFEIYWELRKKFDMKIKNNRTERKLRK